MKPKRRTVTLELGGRRYKVVTTAEETQLLALARMVEERIDLVRGPREAGPDAILLAALSLANDLVEERQRADRVLRKAKGAARELLERVDRVVSSIENGEATSDGPGARKG